MWRRRGETGFSFSDVLQGKVTLTEAIDEARGKVTQAVGGLSGDAFAGLAESMRPAAAQALGKAPADVTDAELYGFIASLPTQQIAMAVQKVGADASRSVGRSIALGFAGVALVIWLTRKK